MRDCSSWVRRSRFLGATALLNGRATAPMSPLNLKKEPLKMSDPFAVTYARLLGIRFLVLLNRGSLSGPHLPTSVAFDVGISEASPTIKRLSFGVFTSHAIYARHDR